MSKRRQAAAALVVVTAIGHVAMVQADSKHWTYSGHEGPAEWGALSPEFATCKLGKDQSPIDIRGAKSADLPPIKFNYEPSPLNVIDNGHTIQVNYAPGSSIEVGNTRYELVQFHFHKPSEEKVDGKSHAMVAHLVQDLSDERAADTGAQRPRHPGEQVVRRRTLKPANSHSIAQA